MTVFIAPKQSPSPHPIPPLLFNNAPTSSPNLQLPAPCHPTAQPYNCIVLLSTERSRLPRQGRFNRWGKKANWKKINAPALQKENVDGVAKPGACGGPPGSSSWQVGSRPARRELKASSQPLEGKVAARRAR